MAFYRSQVLVCGGTGCTSSGCNEIAEAMKASIKEHGIENEIELVKTGCFGLCELGPIVIVYPEGSFYSQVKVEDAAVIVEEHLVKGRVVNRLLYQETVTDNGIKSLNETGFYKKQMRVALRNCGVINPENIDEYLALDGYKALEKVLLHMSREEVIDTLKESGLRGRGGGGFPTGLKWEFAAKQTNPVKYMICNADEGDPGAFMDRSILEGDPHSLIEAMAIGAYAVGSNQGYIYVRAEYPIAVQRLEVALEQAREYGLLGKNIFESGFDFDLEVRLGAGAFVCGEETALMNSIEGKRGMPNPKPPFPAVSGLWEKPSIINNVETYANIPVIFNKGAQWFKSIGTENNAGTKVFALGGNIVNTGLVEIPMGTTLREVIFEIGGGIPNGKKFKAVQTGGPSGGALTEADLDTPIDYDNLIKLGSMMGSGGMIVMDEDTCMVDVAKFFLDFTREESCGKCTPCRVGTKRLLEILEKITEGKGTMDDIDKLERLAKQVKATSLCGLGQTAPNPILSTLENFRHEYEAHIIDKTCPAGICKELLKYTIIEEPCKKCGLCQRACPVGAIEGKVRESFVIDQDKCIKCGACLEKCPFNAIERK